MPGESLQNLTECFEGMDLATQSGELAWLGLPQILIVRVSEALVLTIGITVVS